MTSVGSDWNKMLKWPQPTRVLSLLGQKGPWILLSLVPVGHLAAPPDLSICLCPTVGLLNLGSRLFQGPPCSKISPGGPPPGHFQGLKPPAGHTFLQIVVEQFPSLLTNSAILYLPSPVAQAQLRRGHPLGRRDTPRD